MWMIMCLQEWKDVGGKACGALAQVDGGLSIGYLPVYSTREDAEKDYPGCPKAQVAFVKEVNREPRT
jgi:hypothetical protein